MAAALIKPPSLNEARTALWWGGAVLLQRSPFHELPGWWLSNWRRPCH